MHFHTTNISKLNDDLSMKCDNVKKMGTIYFYNDASIMTQPLKTAYSVDFEQ